MAKSSSVAYTGNPWEGGKLMYNFYSTALLNSKMNLYDMGHLNRTNLVMTGFFVITLVLGTQFSLCPTPIYYHHKDHILTLSIFYVSPQ